MSGDAAGGKVRFNFGDGSNAEGEFGEATEHHYTKPGTFTISAADEEGHRGTTKFTVPDDAFDPKPEPPASPVIDVADATGEVNTVIDVSSHMTNAVGTSESCTGAVDYSAPGLTPAKLTAERDNAVLSLTQDGADKVKGTYADAGFSIPPGFDATSAFEFTATEAGTITARHRVLDADGQVLATAGFTLTVEEAP